jgi:tripartite-type tricarboxylate transporter receptor subunit TctC
MTAFTCRGLALAAVAAGLVLAPAARAQDYPNKPITMIVPFAPGGPTDVVGRIVSQRMSEALGQPIVIENKAGAGGRTGIEAMSRAAPDGYTLGVVNTATQSIIPNTVPKMSYDSVTSFTPIGLIGTYTLVLVCGPKMPATDVKGLVAHGKANPGAITFGSPGGGGHGHFIAEYFRLRAGLDVRHVFYRGTGPLQADIISGNVDCVFDGGAKELIEAGKMKAYMVSRTARDPVYPNLPTFEEVGLKGADMPVWMAIMGPSGLAADTTKKLHTALDAAMKDENVKQKILAFGTTPPAKGGPETLVETIKRDLDLYKQIASEAQMKFE